MPGNELLRVPRWKNRGEHGIRGELEVRDVEMFDGVGQGLFSPLAIPNQSLEVRPVGVVGDQETDAAQKSSTGTIQATRMK